MINRTQEEIMQNWDMDNSEEPLVSVRCITYNHESYIAQALDGFLMQKTNFPFEVIVHDDASTDKTADIIREYETMFPKIIKPIYETENQYSKRDGSLTRIMNAACKGKYIALCEGDDYWIDENKLQMQVDFLERNPEYGMCYTKVKNYIQDELKKVKPWGGTAESFSDLFAVNTVPTLSVVFRTQLKAEYDKNVLREQRKWLIGDYPIWLWFSLKSKVKFMNCITGVYRVLSESASHSLDISKRVKIARNIHEIRIYFSKLANCNVPEFDENREYARFYFNKRIRKEANRYFKKIKNKTGKEKLLTCITANPLFFSLYKLYAGR